MRNIVYDDWNIIRSDKVYIKYLSIKLVQFKDILFFKLTINRVIEATNFINYHSCNPDNRTTLNLTTVHVIKI